MSLNVITKAENLLAKSLWEQCFSAFLSENRQKSLDVATSAKWLSAMKHIAVEDYVLRLEAPSELAKDWFEQDFSAIFLSIAKKIDPSIQRIAVFAPSAAQYRSMEVLTPPPITVPVSFNHSRFCKKYRIENFIAETSNEEVLNAAKWLSAESRENENFLLLKGGAGLGKTHLLHAIGREASAKWAKRAVLWDSDKFFKEKRSGDLSVLLQADLFLFDNLHNLASSENAQEELLRILKALNKNGRSMAMSINPKNAQAKNLGGGANLIPELADFLKIAVKCELKLPDLRTRTAILKQKAKEIGLPAAVIENLKREWILIAQTVGENICSLEGAVNELVAKQNLLKCEISPALVRSMYGAAVGADGVLGGAKSGKGVPSLLEIARAVAAAYQIPSDALCGKNRSARVNKPRQIAMYLCQQTGLSLKEIGKHFNRDSSSVASAINTLKKKIAGADGFALEIEIKQIKAI